MTILLHIEKKEKEKKRNITTEILKLMGVRLRDSDLYNYAQAEDSQE